MNKRKSKIWLVSTIDFAKCVADSSSFKELLAYFSLENKGSNYKTAIKRMVEENVSYEHFKKSKDYLITFKAAPIEDLLVRNSSTGRTNLKKRLLKEGFLENKCYNCGQLPIWNGLPLVLTLDHINGVSNDNRLENLRILCGHCHSQTTNFAGRNKRVEHNKCLDCATKVLKTSTRCNSCAMAAKPPKFDWSVISDADLLRKVNETSYLSVAKLLGCSDNAIRKRLKKLKLI